jgi:hypothetical protein
MKNWILKNKLLLLGSAIGAIAGYLYYWQIGCATGACAITSKPLNSIVYFGVMGGIASGIFKKQAPVEKKPE